MNFKGVQKPYKNEPIGICFLLWTFCKKCAGMGAGQESRATISIEFVRQDMEIGKQVNTQPLVINTGGFCMEARE